MVLKEIFHNLEEFQHSVVLCLFKGSRTVMGRKVLAAVHGGQDKSCSGNSVRILSGK